jgi:hypothetical protein
MLKCIVQKIQEKYYFYFKNRLNIWKGTGNDIPISDVCVKDGEVYCDGKPSDGPANQNTRQITPVNSSIKSLRGDNFRNSGI